MVGVGAEWGQEPDMQPHLSDMLHSFLSLAMASLTQALSH